MVKLVDEQNATGQPRASHIMLTHKMVRRRPSQSIKSIGQNKMAFRETRSRAEGSVSRIQGEGTEVQSKRGSPEVLRPAGDFCQAFIQGSQIRDLPSDWLKVNVVIISYK